ncbi:MAG: murein biosynthesis integral membrane protein MurJ, partial [Candidatus Sungbacteria bacterium]|nr:murein biosynthesis integral membrane protein MurJ [Candidatus Sungbacteria bacterium]
MIKKLLKFNGSISSIHAAAFLIGSAALISRLLGMFRNRLLATHFGAGRELDVYFAAFQIPDFVATLFLLGAGSAAILPVFQEYMQDNKERARHLISSLQTSFLVASSIVAMIVFFFVPLLLRIMVPGFSDADRSLTALLTRIMLLSPILLGLSSILSAVVQSFQRFFAYALAPIFYNIGIIIGIIFFVPAFGIMGLGMGVVLGALMHLTIQIISITQVRMMPRIIFRNFSGGLKKVVSLSLPRVISLSLAQVTVVGLTALGSTLHAGSISVLKLSQDLYFVPVALIGVSYSVVIFPRLSEAFLNRNADTFYRELFLGLRTIALWITPTIALFIVLRAHIVRVAYGAGQFSWEDTRLTAASLAILAIAMIAGSITQLLIKAFYAIEKTWMPLVINMFASALAISSAIFFSHALRGSSAFASLTLHIFRVSDLPSADVLGLALGFTLGLLVDNVLLYIALRSSARAAFNTAYEFPLRPMAHIAVAAALAGISAYLVRLTFQPLPLVTLARVLLQGLMAGIVGFTVYIVLLTMFKN